MRLGILALALLAGCADVITAPNAELPCDNLVTAGIP
jgi:hypothetical protein